MKKFLILVLLLAISFVAVEAQIKDLNISDRDLSSYTPKGKKGSLSGTTTDNKPASIDYHTMGKIHANQFSGVLSAEFADDRPVLISGVIKGSDTRDVATASYNYLLEAKNIMGINDPINEFVNVSTITDEKGNRHVKMQQVYNGIPVYGNEVILHEKRDQFESLNGHFAKTPENINIVPSLNLDQNKSLITADLPHPLKAIDHTTPGHEDLKQWDEELVILPSEGEESFRLAYHTTVYTSITNRVEYFVDAHTGEIINSYGSLCKLHAHHDHTSKNNIAPSSDIQESTTIAAGNETANATDLFGNSVSINVYETGGNYYMVDASRDMFNASSSNLPDEPVGTIWTIDAFNTSPQNSNSFKYDHVTSSNNNWSDPGAVSAHYNGGKAYVYFKNVHSRNAIDDKGGNIVSLVNVADENGNSMENAFWNGQAMFYGNGGTAFKPLARALDVAGHELTHGVVQSTANLVYQGQAGAINESMADIFGAMIDRDDWLIGEDVVNTSVFPSGALRSLVNPNQGQATNDFGKGWQPAHVNEMYTGTQDNGGVHLNSGIVNHAFYKFATNTSLGSTDNERKIKAEKVYYKALTQYLTKNSQFVDLRIAVVKAAGDLYSTAVVDAAKQAFNEVGIGEGPGGNYESDYEANPGQEWLLVTDAAKTKLILLDDDRVVWANPLSTVAGSSTPTAPLSKPSVSDSGKDIVFVGQDNKIHLVKVDWGNTGDIEEFVFEDQAIWRNVVVSKDGTKLAALKDTEENKVHIYDDASGEWSEMTLVNPTYTDSITTGDVKFADAMEFDPAGEWLMYDSKSEISSNSGSTISWWDIGFIRVWDNENNTWGDEKTQKLFSQLPDGISVANPTFSKNSGYVIAFDYIQGIEDVTLLGANIEKNETGVLTTDLFTETYPNYSSSDQRLAYDFDLLGVNVGILDLQEDKINGVAASEDIYLENTKWGVFFSDGVRDFVGSKDLATPEEISFQISPNPVKDQINISLESKWTDKGKVQIYNIDGQLMMSESIQITKGDNNFQLDGTSLMTGMYLVEIVMPEGRLASKFMKEK